MSGVQKARKRHTAENKARILSLQHKLGSQCAYMPMYLLELAIGKVRVLRFGIMVAPRVAQMLVPYTTYNPILSTLGKVMLFWLVLVSN